MKYGLSDTLYLSYLSSIVTYLITLNLKDPVSDLFFNNSYYHKMDLKACCCCCCIITKWKVADSENMNCRVQTVQIIVTTYPVQRGRGTKDDT
jgi:hypothetical protein